MKILTSNLVNTNRSFYPLKNKFIFPQLYTDAVFLAPHWKQLKYLSKKSQPVFVYRFSQNKQTDAGGFGSELPFIFGPLRKDQVNISKIKNTLGGHATKILKFFLFFKFGLLFEIK